MTKKERIELIIKHIIDNYEDLGTERQFKKLIDNSITEILEICEPRKLDAEKINKATNTDYLGYHFATTINSLIDKNYDIWCNND